MPDVALIPNAQPPVRSGPRPGAWRRLARAVGPASLAAIGYTLLHLSWLALHWTPEAWRIVVADAFFAPVFLLCAVAAYATGRRQLLDAPGTQRWRRYRAWQLVALAYVLLWIANIVWYYYDVVHAGAPLHWSVEFLTRVSYVPFLAGVLLLPTAPRGRAERAALILDVSTVVLGAGGFIWYFVLRPQASELVSGVSLVASDFFTPLADLAVISVLAALLLRGPDADSRARLRWLLAGHGMSVSAGVAFGYLQANGLTYTPGDPLDALWALSNICIFIGVAGPPATRALGERRRSVRAGGVDVDLVRHSLVPYVFVVAGLGLLAIASRAHWQTALGGVVALVSAITLLVVIRQVMVLAENDRLLEERLTQDARFRSLVQQASDITTVIDATGCVLYQSPSSERLLGAAPETLVGTPLSPHVHPQDVGPLADAIGTLVEGGAAAALPLRLRHASGEWRSFETVGTNLLDDASVRGIVLHSRDVSERLELEERLRRAQKLEAVGRLAGGIAHDFNNLLTVVRSNAELLRHETATGDPRRQYAREIEDAAQRAAALTRQLLAFSRRQIVRPQRLDLGFVLDGVDALLRRVLGPLVRLEVTHDARLWTVEADPGQLEQIVMNLAVNARDAMPAGGTLTIATANVTLDAAAARGLAPLRPGDYVALTVADTGCGMSPEVLTHLFEPFFTTKPQGEGTGLGLSTVFGIARQAGGHVAVSSEEGAGATFTVYLPRVHTTEPGIALSPARTFTPVHGVPAIGAPVAGAARVALVVDDEDAVRSTTRRILERTGYTVLVARNGEDALRVTDAHPGPIHVLVTDVVMPVMGGRELAERFAARRPDAGIVFTSGYTEDPSIVALANGPGRAFVAKPFEVVALREAVSGVIEGRATSEV